MQKIQRKKFNKWNKKNFNMDEGILNYFIYIVRTIVEVSISSIIINTMIKIVN